MKTYLITGAAGFVGANFLKYILKKYKDIRIIALDKLTYAGNIETISKELKNKKVKFIKGDICNKELVENIFNDYDIDYVVHFAAESHVDRSIEDPQLFLITNILGTENMLSCAKQAWIIGKDKKGYPIYKKEKKFHHVSTDEVFGSLSRDYIKPVALNLDKKVEQIVARNRKNIKTYGKKLFTETTPSDPRSPYSASKASSDYIVRAYGKTYHFPYNITNCSNNYGPYQLPEKLIPLVIKNILNGKKLPVYGEGKNVRDWLYVEDHCKAIDMVINKGKIGEVYNIGGFNEEENINIVKLIIATVKKLIIKYPKYQKILKTKLSNINEKLITYVTDRMGHDTRYAINPRKIVTSLGWYPETPFDKGIEKTIKWYLENQKWVEKVSNENQQKYYDKDILK